MVMHRLAIKRSSGAHFFGSSMSPTVALLVFEWSMSPNIYILATCQANKD